MATDAISIWDVSLLWSICLLYFKAPESSVNFHGILRAIAHKCDRVNIIIFVWVDSSSNKLPLVLSVIPSEGL